MSFLGWLFIHLFKEKYQFHITLEISSGIIAIIFLSVLLLIIIILVIGIFIGKKLFETRKTKVNELLELYDYSSKQNNLGEKNDIIK